MLRNLKGEPAHLTEEDWGNQEKSVYNFCSNSTEFYRINAAYVTSSWGDLVHVRNSEATQRQAVQHSALKAETELMDSTARRPVPRQSSSGQPTGQRQQLQKAGIRL